MTLVPWIRLLAPALLLSAPGVLSQSPIPLPEHPRPDFQRSEWQNLNGPWHFRFDAKDAGEAGAWFQRPLESSATITVPFSWGAPLSGVADSADIGWYERQVAVPTAWRGKRVFLVVGASDWRTSAWLDGVKIGEHQGGYTPFSFELPAVAAGTSRRLTLRVDDSPHAFKLEGKQGYGKARGIWQTIYLEARGSSPLRFAHFTPHLATSHVRVDAELLEPAPKLVTVTLSFPATPSGATPAPVTQRIPRGERTAHFDVAMPGARLWSTDDPHLYDASLTVRGDDLWPDSVNTYFGMREISVANLPGTDIPYVAVNGKPVYLQLSLDQAYHPAGFYTFPSDSVLRSEIMQARTIGLTGLREHIKIESPRKLYWADRLGVLIMADVPNWWGPPDSLAFEEHDFAMREMIERDYNHPSVFSWVMYNEAWGLPTRVGGKDAYLPATQQRVIQSVTLAKRLDPTRLVEDNSPCCGRGHTVTDLNTWHEYLPGWRWDQHVARIGDSTFAGSTWNFERGYSQSRQPMLNSEFGNVWGYTGSTGDVDWSWDYHRAIDAFRRHPKLAGWLYTELDDVINEWNGYWRADRSPKQTGFAELVDGMSLRDLHAPYYLAVGRDLSSHAHAGDAVLVPLYASFLASEPALGDSLTLATELYGWNALGEAKTWQVASRRIPNTPWLSAELAPLPVTMPSERAVAVLSTRLESSAGAVLQRNFTTFVVNADPAAGTETADGRPVRTTRVAPSAYTAARWSGKTWNVLDSLKTNGTGAGYFEYVIPWPTGVALADVREGAFLVEASSKRLNGKDRDTLVKDDNNYMRGGGLQDPSRNRNAYPMTGDRPYPSAVTVRVNGEFAGRFELADDPADSRGILSWDSQRRDGFLREAGSYGQLLHVAIPPGALAAGARAGKVTVRLEVDDALPGGLAIYGAHFGRYPLDPTLMLVLRDPPKSPR